MSIICCCGSPLDGSHDHNTCGPPIDEEEENLHYLSRCEKTLDEAIARAKAGNGKEHRLLAMWLEELKFLRKREELSWI